MGTPEQLDLARELIDRIRRDPTTAQVAERLESFCVGLDVALSPILGRRGVAALMHRSLRVAGASHPWLSEPNGGLPTSFDVAALTTRVLQQDAGDAVAGAVALIRTFCDLLASLIGASLTERLLRPILAGPKSATIPTGHTE